MPDTFVALKNAFDVSVLLDVYLQFAPFILGVVSTLVGVAIVKWAINHVMISFSGGRRKTLGESFAYGKSKFNSKYRGQSDL